MDWVVCPSCRLNHRRREDGTCPRCRVALSAGAGALPPEAPGVAMALPAPVAPPAWPDAPLPGAAAESPAPGSSELLPLRLAGCALVLGGLLVLWERFAFPEIMAEQGLAAHTWMSGLFDLGIGIALLAGRTQVAALAQVRVVLGGLLFSIYWLAQKNGFAALIQASHSAGLLLLLLGTPALARRAAAVLLVLCALSLELTSARALRTGRNPAGRLVLALQGGSEPIPDGQVQGQARAYTLSVPDTGWRLRSAAAARRDNAQSDRWLVQPTYDAHVLIMVEELPAGAFVERAAVVEAIVKNLQKAFPGLLADGSPEELSAGTLVRARARVKGRDMAFRLLVSTGEGAVYSLLGFVPEVGLPYVEEDLTAMLGSFTPP